MLRSPAAESRVLRARGASLIVLAAVALAAAGCASAAPAELDPSLPTEAEIDAAALPLCGIRPPVLEALPVRPVTTRDVGEIEAALGFRLPADPECGLVDESRSSGFQRLVTLELGSDPAPIGALSARLYADGWRDLSWGGPPAFVRHGVHVAPSYQSWIDDATGLQSTEAIVIVSLP